MGSLSSLSQVNPTHVRFMIKWKQLTSKHMILAYINLSLNMRPIPQYRHTYTCKHACTHIHTHMHACTHTHTHTAHTELLEGDRRQLEVLGVRDREKASLELWLKEDKVWVGHIENERLCQMEGPVKEKAHCPRNVLCLFRICQTG